MRRAESGRAKGGESKVPAHKHARRGARGVEAPLGEEPPERRLPSLEPKAGSPPRPGLLPLVPQPRGLPSAGADAPPDAARLKG